MPFSSAATAALIALILVSESDFSFLKAVPSDARWASALATASFASARLSLCSDSDSSVSFFFSRDSFSCDSKVSIFVLEDSMELSRSLTPVLQ